MYVSVIKRGELRLLVIFVVVVSTGLPVAPAVADEIFKCVAKDGSPLYQNFPCHIDSLGSLPSIPTFAQTPLLPGGAKIEPVNQASTVKSTYAREPRVGMTADDVRAILGEPYEIMEGEKASGRASIWRYPDGRTVEFDRRRRVLAVER